MRVFSLISFAGLLMVICGWLWVTHPESRNWVTDLLNTGKFQTLEVRYTAESIMDYHKKSLLKDSDHIFLEPTLKFYPYLLLEVKYNRTHDKTNEGIILWSLVDGEMVINTSSWDVTHGFKDCISSGADKDDFKIINLLAAKGGSLDRESLCKILNVDDDTLDAWVDNCRKKSLIVQTGNKFRLHFQNPKLLVIPETKIDQGIVTKIAKFARLAPTKYRSSQIESIAKAAFGNDFAICKKTEIFLPVYSIVVQNPDGSQRTTYWNALNGKKLARSYHID
jgi:hypothetical protein